MTICHKKWVKIVFFFSILRILIVFASKKVGIVLLHSMLFLLLKTLVVCLLIRVSLQQSNGIIPSGIGTHSLLVVKHTVYPRWYRLQIFAAYICKQFCLSCKNYWKNLANLFTKLFGTSISCVASLLV